MSVSITLEQGGYLVVHVDHEGTAPTSTSEPGLGSKILDEVCLSWDFTLNARGGASLRAVLPMQSALASA